MLMGYIKMRRKPKFSLLNWAIRTPQFSVVMKRLTEDKDNLGNLVAACPGLEQDPVALALLSRPENLMMVFTPDPHSAEQVRNFI